jgi:hypothetical protein
MIHFLETKRMFDSKEAIVQCIVVKTSVDYVKVSYVQY